MAFQYKPATLKKLEAWFKEAGYLIRYERGNFNSGYCILEQKRVVVINKFFDLEARLNALVDIQTEILPALRERNPDLAEDGAEWVEARAAVRPDLPGGVHAEGPSGAEPENVASDQAEQDREPGSENASVEDTKPTASPDAALQDVVHQAAESTANS